MNHKRHFTSLVVAALALAGTLHSQNTLRKDAEFVSDYITPVRVMKTDGAVTGAPNLMEPYKGQVSTTEPRVTVFKTTGGKKASVLLDFGKEMQGGLEITRAISGNQKAAVFHVCFGESVTEAMSDVYAKGSTATNEHSVRDFEISVPWLGAVEFGNTGFRFVRLDLVSEDVDVPVVAIRAVSRYRDIPYLGSFKCNDERLNKIWETGAYTVHLNMQDYIWDGIKRDRLVWIGDMHPEVMTVNTVFGDHKVVEKSLDYVRDGTPATAWMNGICSYSLWWIIIHHHLYEFYGDKQYLAEQFPYMKELLRNVIANVDGSRENYKSGRFIDWPTNDNPDAIHCGLQALTIRALEAGRDIASWLGDPALKEECSTVAARMRTYVPDPKGNKEAAALLSIQGMLDADAAAKVIVKDRARNFTSFMGYYMLEALARSGDYATAMELISEYWGRMIDLGGTTFWEDFNYDNRLNAAPIDDFVPAGKFDIHADGGAYCYVGLRHSFCHGWASGPTTWLSRHVLGIECVEPGFRKVRIEPHLGNLEWVEGTFPTPYGVISVSHKKDPATGKVVSKVKLPKGVKRVK